MTKGVTPLFRLMVAAEEAVLNLEQSFCVSDKQLADRLRRALSAMPHDPPKEPKS